MDTKEIRLANLRALLAEAGGKQIRLAERLKKSASQLNKWFSGHRTITEDSAREIEANVKKPRGWLDQIHSAIPTPSTTATKDGTVHPLFKGVAHAMQLDAFTVPPITTWEDLMKLNDIPPTFRVAVPDDALAPKIARGTEVIMAATGTARPGQVILVQDGSGGRHLRRYAAGDRPPPLRPPG